MKLTNTNEFLTSIVVSAEKPTKGLVIFYMLNGDKYYVTQTKEKKSFCIRRNSTERKGFFLPVEKYKYNILTMAKMGGLNV